MPSRRGLATRPLCRAPGTNRHLGRGWTTYGSTTMARSWRSKGRVLHETLTRLSLSRRRSCVATRCIGSTTCGSMSCTPLRPAATEPRVVDQMRCTSCNRCRDLDSLLHQVVDGPQTVQVPRPPIGRLAIFIRTLEQASLIRHRRGVRTALPLRAVGRARRRHSPRPGPRIQISNLYFLH